MKINVARYVFPLGCALINELGSFYPARLQRGEENAFPIKVPPHPKTKVYKLPTSISSRTGLIAGERCGCQEELPVKYEGVGEGGALKQPG